MAPRNVKRDAHCDEPNSALSLSSRDCLAPFRWLFWFHLTPNKSWCCSVSAGCLTNNCMLKNLSQQLYNIKHQWCIYTMFSSRIINLFTLVYYENDNSSYSLFCVSLLVGLSEGLHKKLLTPPPPQKKKKKKKHKKKKKNTTRQNGHMLFRWPMSHLYLSKYTLNFLWWIFQCIKYHKAYRK